MLLTHDHDREHTLAECAEVLGVSVDRARQIEAQALRKIRLALEQRGIDAQVWHEYLQDRGKRGGSAW